MAPEAISSVQELKHEMAVFVSRLPNDLQEEFRIIAESILLLGAEATRDGINFLHAMTNAVTLDEKKECYANAMASNRKFQTLVDITSGKNTDE